MISDEHLVARAQAGDTAAMDAIVARYENVVAYTVTGFYSFSAEHEDLKQEARIGIFKAVRDYKPGPGSASFATFAFLCCKRQLYTAIKTATRMKHEALTWASRSAVNDEGDEVGSVDSFEDPRADTVSLLHRRARVAAAVAVVRDGLSELERVCFEGIVNGETYLELQSRLGYPMLRWPDGSPRPKVVENAWMRAQAKIRRALAEADSVPLGRAA